MFGEELNAFIKRRDLQLLLVLFAFFTLFTSIAAAQEAAIVGTVMDSTGAAVADASIVITNTDTGISRTIATSSEGQ
jgi:hypothetical protein